MSVLCLEFTCTYIMPYQSVLGSEWCKQGRAICFEDFVTEDVMIDENQNRWVCVWRNLFFVVKSTCHIPVRANQTHFV